MEIRIKGLMRSRFGEAELSYAQSHLVFCPAFTEF